MVACTADSEAPLIARWRDGGSAAWAEVFAAYRSLVFSAVLKVVRDHHEAEEITNDCFIAAHRNLDKFRGDCAIGTWLRCIAHRKALNRYHYWRRRHRSDWLAIDAPTTDGGSTLAQVIPDTAPSTIEQAHVSDQVSAIARAIQHLSPEQRSLIYDRCGGATYHELAARRGINVGTVKSRIARARERLTQHLAA